MDPLKHMEVLFGAAVVAALLIAVMPRHETTARAGVGAGRGASSVPPTSMAATTTTSTAIQAMPVVIIKGKRMTGREKRRAALTDSGVAAPARS